MIYELLIELTYLGGREPLPDDARRALTSAVLADLSSSAVAGFTVSHLTIATDPAGTVGVYVILQGSSPYLTRPLEAITRLDTSLDRSLMRTGLFEEFDVARKTLRAAPFERPRRTTL
jgi:hypothetical protein